MKNISLNIPLTMQYLFPLAKICSKTFEMVTGLVESPRNQKQETFWAYIFRRELITE